MSTGDTIRTALEGYVSEGWCQESLDEGNAALAALSALLQERDRMQEALKPFATHYLRMRVPPEDYSYMDDRIKDWFGVSDFEHADAAMEPAPQEGRSLMPDDFRSLSGQYGPWICPACGNAHALDAKCPTQPLSAASAEAEDAATLRRACSACGHAPHVGKCGAELPEDTYLGSHCGCEGEQLHPAQQLKQTWRVGSKVPLNVYEGDRPVCQCHTEEDARRIVAAMNRSDLEALQAGNVKAAALDKFADVVLARNEDQETIRQLRAQLAAAQLGWA